MSKKFIIIIVNLIIILIVAFWLMSEIDTYKGLKEVVVAKAPIPKGTKITSQMLEKKKVTLNQEGKGTKGKKDLVTYYSDVYLDFNKIVGQYARYDFVQGEIVVSAKLTKDFVFADKYLYNLPKGYYAIPMSIKDLASIIKINDFVDFYIYVGGAVFEEPALRHLKVYDLRYEDGTSVSQPIATTSSGNTVIKLPTKAIFALNDYQLKKYVDFAEKNARFTMVIRKRPQEAYEAYDNKDLQYPNYAVTADELIDTTKDQALIEEYKLKIESEQIEQLNNTQTTKTTTTTGTTPTSTTTTGTTTATQPGTVQPTTANPPSAGQSTTKTTP